MENPVKTENQRQKEMTAHDSAAARPAKNDRKSPCGSGKLSFKSNGAMVREILTKQDSVIAKFNAFWQN